MKSMRFVKVLGEMGWFEEKSWELQANRLVFIPVDSYLHDEVANGRDHHGQQQVADQKPDGQMMVRKDGQGCADFVTEDVNGGNDKRIPDGNGR